MKGSAPLRVKVTDSLVKADHALLDQVVVVTPDQVEGASLLPDQVFMFFHQIIPDILVSFPQATDQFFI